MYAILTRLDRIEQLLSESIPTYRGGSEHKVRTVEEALTIFDELPRDIQREIEKMIIQNRLKRARVIQDKVREKLGKTPGALYTTREKHHSLQDDWKIQIIQNNSKQPPKYALTKFNHLHFLNVQFLAKIINMTPERLLTAAGERWPVITTTWEHFVSLRLVDVLVTNGKLYYTFELLGRKNEPITEILDIDSDTHLIKSMMKDWPNGVEIDASEHLELEEAEEEDSDEEL